MATAAPTPRPWNPDIPFKLSDRERWICIYPVYINSKRTVAQGRRLRKDLCVDNPTYSEIRDALVHAGMTIGVENKVHPRERDPKDLKFRGRVRVQLKNDDGTPVMEQFPTRLSVLEYLGVAIGKLKNRQTAGPGSSQSAGTQPQATSGGSGGKKKRGKRK